MDITTTVLILVAFFSLLLGVFLPFAYFSFKAYRMKKVALKKFQSQMPMVGPIVEGTTCDSKGERHEWKSFPLVMANNFDPNNPEPEETLVCTKCGTMSGKNTQFSPNGLKMLLEKQAMAEEAQAFSAELESYRKKELERRLYDFMEKTLIPEKEEAYSSGFYSKLYYHGVDSLEAIASEINAKIQQKQAEQAKEQMRKLYESYANK